VIRGSCASHRGLFPIHLLHHAAICRVGELPSGIPPYDIVGRFNRYVDLSVFDGHDAILSGADVSGADLRGAQNLTCEQLTQARWWEEAYRDPNLPCGASIPEPPSYPPPRWFGHQKVPAVAWVMRGPSGVEKGKYSPTRRGPGRWHRASRRRPLIIRSWFPVAVIIP
jgi:hypothetical protein